MSTFGRKISVVFRNKATNATITPDGDNLNIGFTIERNLDLEPSTMEATLFNLKTDTQEALKDTESGWEITLSAGYGDDTSAIFTGDVRHVRHRREPPLLATDIEADDGGEAAQKTVTRHFAKGTTVGTVFKWMQEQSGLGAGNVTSITQINKPDGLPDRLKNGLTVRGFVMDEMGDLAKSRGAILSSQNGEVILLKPGEALPGAPVTRVSSATGLMGYPYVDNEGVVTFNHRLTPNIAPGAPVDIESEFVNLRIVVERAVYSGTLWGSDFNVEVEGRKAL